MTATKEFVSDLTAIRERARAKMMDGAVTKAYKADRERVIDVLNEALATEIVCVLRYKSHYYRPGASTRNPWRRNSCNTPLKSKDTPT